MPPKHPRTFTGEALGDDREGSIFIVGDDRRIVIPNRFAAPLLDQLLNCSTRPNLTVSAAFPARHRLSVWGAGRRL